MKRGSWVFVSSWLAMAIQLNSEILSLSQGGKSWGAFRKTFKSYYINIQKTSPLYAMHSVGITHIPTQKVACGGWSKKGTMLLGFVGQL